MRQELQQGIAFSAARSKTPYSCKNESNKNLIYPPARTQYVCFCRSCGYVIECPNCDVSLYHHTEAGAPELLRCHYCNFVRSHPRNCPECSSLLKILRQWHSASRPTQQFPQLRFIRFDSDTTARKGRIELLTRFANREADLLVGTQMLTKDWIYPKSPWWGSSR